MLYLSMNKHYGEEMMRIFEEFKKLWFGVHSLFPLTFLHFFCIQREYEEMGNNNTQFFLTQKRGTRPMAHDNFFLRVLHNLGRESAHMPLQTSPFRLSILFHILYSLFFTNKHCLNRNVTGYERHNWSSKTLSKEEMIVVSKIKNGEEPVISWMLIVIVVLVMVAMELIALGKSIF